MADTPDLSDLARRWFEMWEEQWRALASDPETAESLRRLTALMGGAGAPGANPFAAWMAANPFMANPFMAGGAHGSAAPGATPAAGPSGGGADAVDDLGRRLAALERRVADLESRGSEPAKPAKPAASKPVATKPAATKPAATKPADTKATAPKPAARSRKPSSRARRGPA